MQRPLVHALPGKLVSSELVVRELRREGEALLDRAQAVAKSAGRLPSPVATRIAHVTQVPVTLVERAP